MPFSILELATRFFMDALAVSVSIGAQTEPDGPIAQALNRMIARAFEPLAYMLFGLLIASPAIASMLLLAAGARWPQLMRSAWLNALAGIVLPIAVALALFQALRLLVLIDGRLESVTFIALALLAVAVWLQIRARATFTWARAAGLVAIVATLVAFLMYNSAVHSSSAGH